MYPSCLYIAGSSTGSTERLLRFGDDCADYKVEHTVTEEINLNEKYYFYNESRNKMFVSIANCPHYCAMLSI